MVDSAPNVNNHSSLIVNEISRLSKLGERWGAHFRLIQVAVADIKQASGQMGGKHEI